MIGDELFVSPCFEPVFRGGSLHRAGPQVVYPVLMIVLSYRTHRVRVAPDTLIVFKPAGEEENDGTDGTVTSSFLSKVRTGLKEDHSMFAWANTGAWETVETPDEETVREGDQFRIGFEPLFVDFTKKTSWFTVYFLLEVLLSREKR